MAIIQNAIKGKCTFKATSNTTFSVSDLAAESNTWIENVTGASIIRILASGPATVFRGSNVVFQCVKPDTFNLLEGGISFTDFSSNNCSITMTGNSTVIVQFSKQSNVEFSTWQTNSWNLSKLLLSGINLIFGRL